MAASRMKPRNQMTPMSRNSRKTITQLPAQVSAAAIWGARAAGSTLLVRLVQLDRLGVLLLLAHADVEHLDGHRERHREVDVALRHLVIETLDRQHDADHEQERQRQHLDRGMRGNEF